MDDLQIGHGNLAGKGVFAGRDFAPGEVVIKFGLRPLTLQDYREQPVEERLFVHSYRGRRWLYPPPARWVNHADEPSCFQDFELSCDVALRPIAAGDAITIDATEETSQELATFFEAHLDAQRNGDKPALRALVASDAVLWKHSRATRGSEEIASVLAENPVPVFGRPTWEVATGRWEALCSAEVADDESENHATLFLRVLDGNWQIVYHHRG